MAKAAGKWMGGGLVAALGLSALSPVQQAGVALTVAGVAMWSAPALAQTGIPGVGLVVKKKPGNAPIIVPSDKDGITRLTGLEPGEYEVKLFGDVAPVTMKVGRDGRLAFVAMQDSAKATVATREGKTRGNVPVMRQWVEQIAFDGGRGASPVESFDTRSAAIIDVNTANADALMKGTNNSRETAAFIVAEREKSGVYKSPQDFVQRVGSNVDVDFGYASARLGDTTIIARGKNPADPGFKTTVKSGVVELYGSQHDYVGHVTLLR